ISPPFRSLGDMVSNVNAVGLVPYGETVVACKACRTLQTWPTQFITVCSAENLAEARRISSPVQGSSPAKTSAASRPSRAHGHHLRPSTNCYKLSEAALATSALSPRYRKTKWG